MTNVIVEVNSSRYSETIRYKKGTMFYLICTDIPYCMLQMSLTNVLTEGGPNYSTMTVMQFIYKQFAGSGNYTNANPAAIITFLIILVFTLIPFIFEKKKVYYQ